MALTKKMAKTIALEINELTVCKIMLDSLDEKEMAFEEKHEQIKFWRKCYDDAAVHLNTILDQNAVITFSEARRNERQVNCVK